MQPKLSIVVAVRDGAANVPALLDALKDRRSDGELILCCAEPCSAGEYDAELQLSFPAETLVPSLWSEGILRARGSRVALTTGQFVPADDWLERLRAADLDRWVGVGGAIDNDPAASARNWALFFLRYSAFAPPLPAGETEEIAADNAVYDRAAILEHPDLLRLGFWEPSFHRRFRAAGKKLALDPKLLVVHHGTVSGRSFARQRYLHGRAYGIERAERASFVRNLLLLLSSPLVPPLLLLRIVDRIIRRPRYRAMLFTAFPWLVRFTFAWAAGEAAGYASTLFAPHTGAPPTSKRHA
ncbi:MAG: hypothetical protein ABI454_06375 [Sphingomicrobium sp.]